MVIHRRNVQVLISEGEILRRVQEMARHLEGDYKGKELIVVGLLKGACPFLADLARAVDLDIRMDFMKVSSYGSGRESSGNVKIALDIDSDIDGKHVLVVEDIVDTGQTLAVVIKHLQASNPASVRVCSLLDKPSRRKVDVSADYVGFTIEDYFVVGYGMDLDGLYRNLPYVGVYGDRG